MQPRPDLVVDQHALTSATVQSFGYFMSNTRVAGELRSVVPIVHDKCTASETRTIVSMFRNQRTGGELTRSIVSIFRGHARSDRKKRLGALDAIKARNA